MHALRIVFTAGLLFAATTGRLHAEATPNTAQPPGGETLRLDQYYGDAVSRIGSFPGKLVCVPTGKTVPENATACEPGKVWALAMDAPSLVLPLIAASDAFDQRFAPLANQDVVVRGKHYQDEGFIGVSSIESARTAADAPE
jgi:hypothetical protein